MSNLDPLTAKQLRDAERDKVYIFNVSPRAYQIHVSKLWTIPACPEGGAVSPALEIPGVVYSTKVKKVNGLHVEYDWHGDDGIDVANDIVGTAPFKDHSENLTRFGVFISMTPEPSQEAIDKATARWIAVCDGLVAEADQIASVNNGIDQLASSKGLTVSNIGPQHKEALQALGLQRAWSGVNKRMVQCSECDTPNLPTAARCKNPECWAIFDEEKARRLFPQMFAGSPIVEEKRGPGRPKKEEAA